MIRHLKFYMLIALIASGLVFFFFYTFFEQPETESTGYNSKSHGWYGWASSFKEHDDSSREIVTSGTNIRKDRLLLEIRLCIIIGVVFSILLAMFNKVVNMIHGSVTRHDAPTK